MKNKKIKILLHHDIEESVRVGKFPSTQPLAKRLWFGFLNSCARVGYWVGYSLILVFRFPLFLIEILRQPNQAKFRQKQLLAFALILLIAATPVYLLSLASEGWRLGGRVLGVSDGALSDITAAQSAIAQQNYQLAQVNFTEALSKLEQASMELEQSSLALRAAVKFAPASWNSDNLLKTATLITEAGLEASQMMGQFSQLSFTPQGISSGEQSSAEAISNLAKQSLIIHQKFAEAHSLLAPIQTGLLPAEYQFAIAEVKSLVADLNSQTKQLVEMTELLSLLTLNDKSFLVILQNNNELRATGGFIGTIAQGRIQGGIISKLDIRSVYDLDGQIIEWIKPPSPMQAVNSRLFLRDSNWFASFPESAERISVMYEKSGGETPDLIIAFTPELFLDLLALTGPVYLPNYNLTVSPENFVEQIQTTTSLHYDLQLNQPKQLIADLYPLLMQEVGEKTKNDPIMFLSILQKNLANRNILMYSRQAEIQERLARYRWDGAISDTDGDYLQINSSNLNGTKTDRDLIRSVELLTTIDTDGTIINQLNYKISNPLPNLDGLTNRSWVRFFVPENSRLLGATGFSKYRPDNLPLDKSYQTAPQIEIWEGQLKFNESSLMYSGNESGKTFFANWIEVMGGETKTVSITYQLPNKLNNKVNSYKLLWQRQSGMLPFAITHRLQQTGWHWRWSNAHSSFSDSTAELVWSTELNQDYFRGVVYTK